MINIWMLSSTTGIPYEAVVFLCGILILNTYILSRGLHGVEKLPRSVPLLLYFADSGYQESDHGIQYGHC